MDYQFQEGRLTLPPYYQDRTVNLFVLGSSVPAPLSITVSRDTLLPAEDLSGYIDRQVTMLAAQIRGYTLLGKQPAKLSATQPLQGLQIDAYYLKDGRALYQRQAAFLMEPGRALIFSTTSQGDFNTEQNSDWRALLDSFVPRAASASTAETGKQE